MKHPLQHQYWSVDSAPVRLTRSLSVWAAPTVLAIFVGVSSLLLLIVNAVPAFVDAFPNRDFVFSPYSGLHSIPVRIFILSFFVAYGVMAGATARGRIRLFLELSLSFVLVCGVFDLINVLAYRAAGFVFPLHMVEILSGLFGFFIFSMKLLDHGSMPERATTTPFSRRFKLRSLARIVLAAGVAMVVSHWVDGLHLPLVEDLRRIALLGGTGPGVFLFLPLFSLMLYITGTVQALLRISRPFSPPVTVIVPAHNEAHVLGRTLAAIEAAAARYAGTVYVLVLDNCSTDDTASAAARGFAGNAHIRGRIVTVPVPGKSNALNRGVAETLTDFLIRIDADTQILPHTIRRAMRHFSRSEVGIVGGMPVAPGDGPFDRARDLETLLKHGYYQVAYGAVDGIVGVPGMFAAYRTQAVREAGGFVGGMNGEDTDMSLRIGEMGYRIVGDPAITYVSEVPRTWRHLREQRMRWFRSIYHVAARNRDYLDAHAFSARGKIILPFMLLNSGRRAMTVPLVLFSALNYLYGFDQMSPLALPAILAVVLGALTLMAILAALANGRPGALLGLPDYIAFRLVRSYLTLESMLSISFERQKRAVMPPETALPVVGGNDNWTHDVKQAA